MKIADLIKKIRNGVSELNLQEVVQFQCIPVPDLSDGNSVEDRNSSILRYIDEFEEFIQALRSNQSLKRIRWSSCFHQSLSYEQKARVLEAFGRSCPIEDVHFYPSSDANLPMRSLAIFIHKAQNLRSLVFDHVVLLGNLDAYHMFCESLTEHKSLQSFAWKDSKTLHVNINRSSCDGRRRKRRLALDGALSPVARALATCPQLNSVYCSNGAPFDPSSEALGILASCPTLQKLRVRTVYWDSIGKALSNPHCNIRHLILNSKHLQECNDFATSLRYAMNVENITLRSNNRLGFLDKTGQLLAESLGINTSIKRLELIGNCCFIQPATYCAFMNVMKSNRRLHIHWNLTARGDPGPETDEVFTARISAQIECKLNESGLGKLFTPNDNPAAATTTTTNATSNIRWIEILLAITNPSKENSREYLVHGQDDGIKSSLSDKSEDSLVVLSSVYKLLEMNPLILTKE